MENQKISAEILLKVIALQAEVDQLKRMLSGHPVTAEGWAAPSIAWQALRSEGIKSQKHLQQLRLEGAFSEGKSEIRNVSMGEQPRWEYHVPSCRKALRRHFKQRSA